MIAALYVETNGAYFGLPGVDPWDRERDARNYLGPHPVVAHPPCERWGSFWYGGPMNSRKGIRFKKGDDGGCFAAAVASLRKWGGVLEHPRATGAWTAFGIVKPPETGGWVPAGPLGGWTCNVYQGHYGHRALKPTWLYYVGEPAPPPLKWGRPTGKFVSVSGTSFKSKAHRQAAIAAGWKYESRLPTKERAKTPALFRELLISLATYSIFGDLAHEI